MAKGFNPNKKSQVTTRMNWWQNVREDAYLKLPFMGYPGYLLVHLVRNPLSSTKTTPLNEALRLILSTEFFNLAELPTFSLKMLKDV